VTRYLIRVKSDRLAWVTGSLVGYVNVSKIANVAAVYDDCANKCTVDLGTTAVFDQLNPIVQGPKSWSRRQLGYVSWPPPSVNPSPDLTKYWFDDSAGVGVNVYLVDTGATLSHEEFTRLDGRVRWLPNGVTQGDGYDFHGTCVSLELSRSTSLSLLTHA
jgi:subtilisin family serine protease